MIAITGGCLCGKARYRISRPPISQGVCYCHDCQRSGGPLLVVHADAFERPGEVLPHCVTKSEDGMTVFRNFCGECGCHVYSQISGVAGIVTVKAATLDDPSLFRPEYLVFTRSAGASCVFPEGVPRFLEDAPLSLVLGA